MSAEEVVKSVNRGSNSIYPFMGSNGIPQFHSPTALYSRSKISPVPGLYPVNNAFANTGSSVSKSTLKKKIQKAETQSKCRNDKENLSPEMYEVKRRGSLAKIHRKKQSDGKRKLLSLKAFNSTFNPYLFYICICLLEYKKSSSSDDNTKTSGQSSQESNEISAQTRQNEEVNIGDTIIMYVELILILFKILETLASLGSQIRACSDQFDDIKNRLILVETSFNENREDLQSGFEVK